LKLTARDLLNQANSNDNGNSDFYKNSTSQFNSDRKRANQSNRRRVEEDEFDKVAFNQVKKNEKKTGQATLGCWEQNREKTEKTKE